jgi:hypothetical protein
MTALALVAGSPPRQPSARDELRNAIEQLADAVREQTAAREPIDRLNAILREVAQAEAHLSTCRTADAEALDRWLDDGAASGRPRPTVSPATIEADTRLAQLRAEGHAGRAAMPARERAFTVVAERVKAATAERDRLRFMVAAEAVIAFIRADFKTVARDAPVAEGVIQGALRELQQIGVVSGAPEATGRWSRSPRPLQPSKRASPPRPILAAPSGC